MKSIKLVLLIFLFGIELFGQSISGRLTINSNTTTQVWNITPQIYCLSKSPYLGNATLKLCYDPQSFDFPDKPVNGVDYTFQNFSGGDYYTGTLRKICNGVISLSIAINSGTGKTISKPIEIATINLKAKKAVPNTTITWVNNEFYKPGSTTSLSLGSFSARIYTQNISPLLKSVDNNESVAEIEKESVNSYQLMDNYPNPFNPATLISFSIPESNQVILKVFNILGEEVATLLDRNLSAGKYQVNFDASKFCSGVYIYTIEAGKFRAIKKMILAK